MQDSEPKDPVFEKISLAARLCGLQMGNVPLNAALAAWENFQDAINAYYKNPTSDVGIIQNRKNAFRAAFTVFRQALEKLFSPNPLPEAISQAISAVQTAINSPAPFADVKPKLEAVTTAIQKGFSTADNVNAAAAQSVESVTDPRKQALLNFVSQTLTRIDVRDCFGRFILFLCWDKSQHTAKKQTFSTLNTKLGKPLDTTTTLDSLEKEIEDAVKLHRSGPGLMQRLFGGCCPMFFTAKTAKKTQSEQEWEIVKTKLNIQH